MQGIRASHALQGTVENPAGVQFPALRRAHRTRSVSLGRCLVSSVDDVAEALALAAGEHFK